MEFTVLEIQKAIAVDRSQRPIVFITSNSKRRLPEPFLRRCVYHHIRFDLGKKAVESRRDEYRNLHPDVLELAVKRFLKLRDMSLGKKPATWAMRFESAPTLGEIDMSLSFRITAYRKYQPRVNYRDRSRAKRPEDRRRPLPGGCDGVRRARPRGR
jgi:hypothetical protein